MAYPGFGDSSGIFPILLGEVVGSFEEVASNDFGFVQTATHNIVEEDVSNVFGFENLIELIVINRLAANRIFFDTPYGEGGQLVEHNYIFDECSNEFVFGSVSGYNQELEITQYLGFSDRYFTPAFGNYIGFEGVVRRAYNEDVENQFDWIHHDGLGAHPHAVMRAYLASNDLALAAVAVGGSVEDLYDYFGFEDSVGTADTEFGRPVAQSVIKQHLTFSIQGASCPEKEYAPYIGSSGDTSYPEVSTTPPTLGTGVFTLTYPRVTPTSTLVLKSPVFGNTDTLRFTKLDRRTRGGDRKIFSDLDWGQTQSFELVVENICSPVIDDILDFLNASVGKEIGLQDWENRDWAGVIFAPDTEVIPQIGGWSVRIVFEGELV